MRRELLEEIGVTPERWRFVATLVPEGSHDTSATFHIYQIDKWRGRSRLIGDEHTELRWFAIDALGCEADLALPQLGKMLESLSG